MSPSRYVLPAAAALGLGSCIVVVGGAGASSSFLHRSSDRVAWESSSSHSEPWPADARTLSVLVAVGDVTVEASDDDRWHVEADVRATDRVPAEERRGGFEEHVDVRFEGGVLHLEDRHFDQEGWTVDLELRVPRDAALVLSSDVGDLNVRTGGGAVSVTANVGDVHVEVERSELELLRVEAGVGDVHVDAGYVTRELDLSTDVGDLDVAVGSFTGSECALTTSVGDLEADFQVLQLRDGHFEARTGTGSIELGLPRGLAGTFDLRAGVGDLSGVDALRLDVVERREEDRLLGRFGDSGANFRVSSGVGDVDLKLR